MARMSWQFKNCHVFFICLLNFVESNVYRVPIIYEQYWALLAESWYKRLKKFSKTSDSIQPFVVAAYVVFGNASGEVHESHTFLPLKIISGGNFSPTAFAAS